MTERGKNTVTKAELVDRLATKLTGERGVSDPKRAAEAAYEAMVEVLAENIREEKGTSFRGVGIVTASRRPAKTVRMPQQAEPTVVPERIACNFDLARTFAAELRGDAGSATPPARKTEPKVYGGLVYRNARQVRCVVAGTQARAAEAAGVSLGTVRGWWARTFNPREIELAMQAPGQAVFPDDEVVTS